MFLKKAITLNPDQPSVLNRPDMRKVDFLRDYELVVVADSEVDAATSKDAAVSKTGDMTTFDLAAEIKEHPDNLFVKVFAIKANETNDNGDWFGEDQLRKYYSTFVGVPVFVNHANTDIEQARGKVVHAWYDDERNGVMIIARVDAVGYPELARGIKDRYILGTSMGCQVEGSCCSVCHNYATKPIDYCSHIKEQKGKKVSGSFVCQYHRRGAKDVCPVCSAKKGESKSFILKEQEVHEKNYGLRFIENSFVVRPACHDCGVTEIIDPEAFSKKVAEISIPINAFLKAASSGDPEAGRIKYAGEKEMQDLKTALDLVAGVVQKLVEQRQQVDQDFTKQLVEVMAGLQETADELGQVGYGNLPSIGEIPGTSTPATGTTGTAVPSTPASPAAGAQPATTPVAPSPLAGGASKVHSGPAGQVGSVTSPFTASLSKQLLKMAESLRAMKP